MSRLRLFPILVSNYKSYGMSSDLRCRNSRTSFMITSIILYERVFHFNKTITITEQYPNRATIQKIRIHNNSNNINDNMQKPGVLIRFLIEENLVRYSIVFLVKRNYLQSRTCSLYL